MSKRNLEEFSVDLDTKKAVSVRLFNGINLVDIREFYIDKTTKVKKPGKKGIALTEETWNKLLELKDEINEALEALEEKNSLKKQKTSSKKDAEKDEEDRKAKGNERGDKDEDDLKESSVKSEEA